VTTDPSALRRVQPDDPAYQAQAAAEVEFWGRVHPSSLEASENAREPPGPTERHRNESYTGDPRREWQDTIHDHGHFRTGALLGTSSLGVEGHILETNPDLHLTFFDISPAALARRAEVLGARHPGRVATRGADLNFVEFEPERYDVIVSSSSLHHVTNLEYLAFQINRALRPGGFFFLDDYVGEPRFQFSPEKRRVFERLYERDLARQRGRRPGLRWLDTSDLSPFCGVRSDETLEVLARYLEPLTVRTAGTLLVPLLRSRPLDDHRPTRLQLALGFVRALRNRLLGTAPDRIAIGKQFIRELLLVGDVLSEAGILRPGIAFGVYRKR
jgi:SAM-dependent methyltransferase